MMMLMYGPRTGRLVKTFLLFIPLVAISLLSQGQAGIDTVLNRYRSYLYETSQPLAAHVDTWVGTLAPNGRWPDINYADEHRADWQLWNHLKRLDSLSVAWSNPRSPFYHQARVYRAINLALGDWLGHRYHNPNWWHNQIGVPEAMRDIIILLRDTLTASQLKGALAVMAQLHVHGTGANLIWSADLGFHYGALRGDTAMMDKCMGLIVHEIDTGKGEGIQPDYSFHQHGPRLQMYQYGKAFLFATARLGWEVRGTRWAFPSQKIGILAGFVLKGWQWMARGVNTVPGTMDRSATRQGELRAADMRLLLPFLTQLDPAHAAAYHLIARHQDGEGALEGFRYYPYSDFTAYQTKDFSFFLKTISSRTLPTEVGLNSENLKGWLLNSGDGYLIGNGKEYYDLMPVWDWTKLPGITFFDGARKAVRKAFAGSVSDGAAGLSAMDYGLQDKDGAMSLAAHKIWACYGGTVVCLIAGLKILPEGMPIYTALDQCRLQGKVMADGVPVGHGDHMLHDVRWIWHHGFAYIPLHAATVDLRVGRVQGRWSSINAAQPDTLIADSIFMPVLQDTAEAGGYVLVRCEKPRKARRLLRHPGWKVLRNDDTCQAVRFTDGTLMAAFFSTGRLETAGGKWISAGRPCLLLFPGGEKGPKDTVVCVRPPSRGEDASADHKRRQT
jgi:chondroitin AC lyase